MFSMLPLLGECFISVLQLYAFVFLSFVRLVFILFQNLPVHHPEGTVHVVVDPTCYISIAEREFYNLRVFPGRCIFMLLELYTYNVNVQSLLLRYGVFSYM